MPLPLFLGIAAAAAAGAGVIKSQMEKSKAINAVIDEAEANCKKEALAQRIPRDETDFQKRMRKLLFKYAFATSEKTEKPPISSDWEHLPKYIQVDATRKYSSLSWGEYSFYTFEAVYYHHKKKGIHQFLYYDYINEFDPATGTIDYGINHQKRDISDWKGFEKKFVEQINRIWKMDNEHDTSVLEFCFHHCNEFEKDLSYFKTTEIRDAFKSQCQHQNAPIILRENYSHIKIVKMSEGKIDLQFWKYFPKVESISYSENDSEDEIEAKEREQERLNQEAEEREWKAEHTNDKLIELSSDIAELFQHALYSLYGVMFDKENITFLEEPDFTYEGPDIVDRVNNASNTAQSFINNWAERNGYNK